MAGENSDTEYEYIMWWNVENYRYCWQKYKKSIQSSIFTATSMENTKWRLSLYPAGEDNENYIGYYLLREAKDEGPESIEVDYVLEILGSGDSVLIARHAANYVFINDDSWGWSEFVKKSRVLQSEKDSFLPLNTLTVRCRMRRCENRSQECVQLCAKTVINFEKMSFIWAIEKFNSLKLEQKIPFVAKSASNEVVMTLNLFLCEGQHSDEIIFIDFNCVNKKLKYFLFKVFLIDDEGNKIDCNHREIWCEEYETKRMFHLRLTKTELLGKKSLYLKDDTLSLHCECVFPMGLSFEGIVSTKIELTLPHTDSVDMRSVLKTNILKKQSDDASSLKEDFKALYTEGALSDITLCTEIESFHTHSTVLCARSPVFKAMFTNDMMEKIKGSVDIVDLDADTVCRMLSYMYTDCLEGLQWESAVRLYEAANKYEVLSLRKKCSDFLEDHLSPINVCDALVLADTHQDNDFKMIVQNYIIYSDKCVFFSEEWKMLMKNNSELAAEIMHKLWKK